MLSFYGAQLDGCNILLSIFIGLFLCVVKPGMLIAFTFLGGLVFLIVGAELLVRGASRLAAFLGIAPLVIGLTVVAFGTSSPELAVSLISSLRGSADIALGNVVGSNIFNILFILGISAAIRPLLISIQLIRIDVPLMILVSALLFLFGLNGVLEQLESGILFVGLISYIIFLFLEAKKEKLITGIKPAADHSEKQQKNLFQWVINVGFIIFGLILLILGSQFLVNSAVVLAQKLGISELVIGLTIIAAGTSLPEVATSVMASIKGEQDIAVGNIIGSNIFNILAVLGLSGLVSSGGIQISTAALRFDIPVMLAISVACLPIFFTDGKISRWEGFLFFGYYLAYVVYLLLLSTHHDAAPLYSIIFQLFIIPLTAVTLLVLLIQAVRRKKSKE